MMQFQTLTLYGRSVQHGAEVEKWIWKNGLWSFCDGRKVTRPMPGCLISVLPKIWWTTYGLSPTSPMSHRPPPMRSLVISARLVLHSSVMGQIICFEFCSWMKRNHSVWRFSCLRKLIKHIIHVVHNTEMCFVKFAMFQSDFESLYQSFVPEVRERVTLRSVTDMSCSDSELSHCFVSRPHSGGGQSRLCGSGFGGEESRSPQQ